MAESTPSTEATVESTTDPRAAVPIINHIAFSDIRAALGQGLIDLQRAPAYGLSIGAFYAAGGMVVYMLAARIGVFYLSYPLAAGFALLGPFFAIALYEVSRRLESGQPLSITLAFSTGSNESGSAGAADARHAPQTATRIASPAFNTVPPSQPPLHAN